MSRIKNHNMHRARGFSLVEMLVVLGILVLVISLIIPAVMRARAASKQAQCANNLRQIGGFYQLYAQANDDYIPLGANAIGRTSKPYAVWRTDWNDFLWVRDAPGSACGVFLRDGMITRENAKLLYCPVDVRPTMDIKWQAHKFPAKGDPMPTRTIQIGYGVRPTNRIWLYVSHLSTGTIPESEFVPMAKLDSMFGKALMSERLAPYKPDPKITGDPNPLVYNHGTHADPRVNVLYQDNSVKLVPIKALNGAIPSIEEVDEPYETQNENKSAWPAWQALDRQ